MGTARDHGVTRFYNYQPGGLDWLSGTLSEKRILCSNPTNFNDPWDCKPFFDPASIDDSTQRAAWISFFREQYAGMTLQFDNAECPSRLDTITDRRMTPQ